MGRTAPHLLHLFTRISGKFRPISVGRDPFLELSVPAIRALDKLEDISGEFGELPAKDARKGRRSPPT